MRQDSVRENGACRALYQSPMDELHLRRLHCVSGANSTIQGKSRTKDQLNRKRSLNMKKSIVLAVTLAISQAISAFAGPEEPKQVVAPPPPPPVSFFRPNEFDIGAFATYVTGTNGGGSVTRTTASDGTTFTLSSSGSATGWGGGMDFTYWFPWKYAGVRFQGAGVDISSPTVTVTGSNGFSRSGSGSAAAGVISGDFMMRLPLDDFWPSVHLAPYIFGGGGGLFTGAGGSTINTRFPEVNERFNHASSNVCQVK